MAGTSIAGTRSTYTGGLYAKVAVTLTGTGGPDPIPTVVNGPPSNPDVTTGLLLDHFQCYEATSKTKPTALKVDLVDQFGEKTEITVGRPSLICAPVVKNHNPNSEPVLIYPDDLKNPRDHLVCYDLSAEKAKNDSDDDDDDSKKSKKSRKSKKSKDSDDSESDDSASTNILVSVDNQFGLEVPLTVKKPQLLCVPSLKTVVVQ